MISTFFLQTFFFIFHFWAIEQYLVILYLSHLQLYQNSFWCLNTRTVDCSRLQIDRISPLSREESTSSIICGKYFERVYILLFCSSLCLKFFDNTLSSEASREITFSCSHFATKSKSKISLSTELFTIKIGSPDFADKSDSTIACLALKLMLYFGCSSLGIYYHT